MFGRRVRPPSLTQLVLILLTEAVSSREEVPASLLVHLPHKGLLEGKENKSDDVKAGYKDLKGTSSILDQLT